MSLKIKIVSQIAGQLRVFLFRVHVRALPDMRVKGQRKTQVIFSGSCPPPPQGFPCGSWPQPRLCSRRDSCACPSIGEVHRRGFHSDSRTLSTTPGELITAQPLHTHARARTHGSAFDTEGAWLTCKADLLAAHKAPVFLGFLAVGGFGVCAARRIHRRGRGSHGLSHNYSVCRN